MIYNTHFVWWLYSFVLLWSFVAKVSVMRRAMTLFMPEKLYEKEIIWQHLRRLPPWCLSRVNKRYRLSRPLDIVSKSGESEASLCVYASGVRIGMWAKSDETRLLWWGLFENMLYCLQLCSSENKEMPRKRHDATNRRNAPDFWPQCPKVIRVWGNPNKQIIHGPEPWIIAWMAMCGHSCPACRL